MTRSRSTTPKLKATCPEDLLAFVPIAIGFDPAASVVLLSIEGTRPFHARIDLPTDETDVEDVVRALVGPARRHGIRAVVLIVYDDDTAAAHEVAWSLHDALVAVGITVIDVLRVHDGHYFAVLPGRSPEAYRGTAFDARHHRFAAESVLGGRVTHRSREALAATLRHDPLSADDVSGFLVGAELLSATALRRMITTHADPATQTPPDVVAALVLSLAQPDRRDEAWRWLTRSSARDYIEFWSDVVRRSPPDLVPGAAAVLALAAWLAGEGALAWCAIDRAREVDPHHSLAGLVAELLVTATSPDLWAQIDWTDDGDDGWDDRDDDETDLGADGRTDGAA